MTANVSFQTSEAFQRRLFSLGSQVSPETLKKKKLPGKLGKPRCFDFDIGIAFSLTKILEHAARTMPLVLHNFPLRGRW